MVEKAEERGFGSGNVGMGGRTGLLGRQDKLGGQMRGDAAIGEETGTLIEWVEPNRMELAKGGGKRWSEDADTVTVADTPKETWMDQTSIPSF